MRRQQGFSSIHPKDLSWPFWPVVPLYPYGKRQTIRQEIVKDTIWTFEQVQGIFYVIVPIRMTVVKLSEGGLLVYAPVAPTPECIKLVKDLVAKHGDIKYIILPTVSGIEHKVFVGPFARRFPKAQVFVSPTQWSFPLNLPLSWLGLPGKRTQLLSAASSKAPFAQDFDYSILGPIDLGVGIFEEVAFFHKSSGTLLVNDLLVCVPEEPPAIAQLDPYPLLFHAKDDAFDVVKDTLENRRKGWQRISLFALYFQPNALKTLGWKETFRDAFTAPDRSRKSYFGLFPFRWQEKWKQSFDELRGDGGLLVAPILQTLILNRAPKDVLDWVERVASWNFQQVIPSHFDFCMGASPHQFRQAFDFLHKFPSQGKSRLLPEEDVKLLQAIDKNLSKFGIIPPSKEKI
jgi:Domain of unknown function (DUF4336)